MAKWLLSCDGADEVIEADDMSDAVEQCRDWLLDGDWDTSIGSVRVHGRVYSMGEDGEVCKDDYEVVEAYLPQDEPPCDDGGYEHEWSSDYDLVGGCREAPGVWGHGGGVKILEICRRCGTRKITDTWPQDPLTGEQGGWVEVTYEEGEGGTEDW